MEFDSVDEVLSAVAWKPTNLATHKITLDKQSNMQRTAHVILGEKVSVTHNIRHGRQIIPNGAVGTVISFDRVACTV